MCTVLEYWNKHFESWVLGWQFIEIKKVGRESIVNINDRVTSNQKNYSLQSFWSADRASFQKYWHQWDYLDCLRECSVLQHYLLGIKAHILHAFPGPQAVLRSGESGILPPTIKSSHTPRKAHVCKKLFFNRQKRSSGADFRNGNGIGINGFKPLFSCTSLPLVATFQCP